MVDREKVIKGLECCILHDPDDHCRCAECPYNTHEISNSPCANGLKWDALELLKEQAELAHCKDCKYSIDYSAVFRVRPYKCEKHIFCCEADWFCADGERR